MTFFTARGGIPLFKPANNYQQKILNMNPIFNSLSIFDDSCTQTSKTEMEEALWRENLIVPWTDADNRGKLGKIIQGKLGGEK